MGDERKALPPSTLFLYVLLSISAWLWIDRERLGEPGSFGFYLCIVMSLALLAILFFPNPLTITWTAMWTPAMSVGSAVTLVGVIFRWGMHREFFQILLWFGLQWGAVFFLSRERTLNWLLYDVWFHPAVRQPHTEPGPDEDDD